MLSTYRNLALALGIAISTGSGYGPNFPSGSVRSLLDYAAPGKPKDGSVAWDDEFEAALFANVGTNRFLRIPNGTYKLTKPLTWKVAEDPPKPGESWKCGDHKVWDSGIHLIGESRDGVILKLEDNTHPFNVANPQTALFSTGTANKPCNLGQGDNSGFWNSFSNLTINLGTGNPGAIGIRYLANNVSAIRNVRITAAAGNNGSAGIEAKVGVAGPCLIKDVLFENMDYGIRAVAPVTGIYVENAIFKNQNEAAIENVGGVLAIRNVLAEGQKYFLKNNNTGGEYQPHAGFVTVLSARLFGRMATLPAISSNGMLNLRGVSAHGFSGVLTENDKASASKLLTDHVTSGFQIGKFSGSPPNQPVIRFPGFLETSMNLPVEATPEFPENNFPSWTVLEPNNCNIPPANCDTANDSPRINAALQGTSATVFLKKGDYFIGSPLIIGPNVRRVIGDASMLTVAKTNVYQGAGGTAGLFTIPSANTGDVFIDNLDIGGQSPNSPGLNLFRHEGVGRLILTNLYLRTPGKGESPTINGAYSAGFFAGSVFVENVSSSSTYTTWRFNPGQKIWARQFNLEGESVNVINNGATFWVFGVKSENRQTVVQTLWGGKTELFGGILYADGDCMSLDSPPPCDIPNPAFVNVEGQMSAGFSAWEGAGHSQYKDIVVEQVGTQTRTLTRDHLWSTPDNHRFAPLYSGVRTYSGGVRGCWATTLGIGDAINCLTK